MACTCNGAVYRVSEGEDPMLCYDMEELRGHYAKWNKPVTKEQIPLYFTPMKYLMWLK